MTGRHTLALSLLLSLGSFSAGSTAGSAAGQAPRAYRVDDLGTLGGTCLYGSAMNVIAPRGGVMQELSYAFRARPVGPLTIAHLEVEPTAVLWPPNGRMVSIRVNAAATDEYDVEPVCRITSVTNSEGPRGGHDPDVELTGLLSVNLRAKRLGRDHGRRYTLHVACANYLGNVTTAWTVVRVPGDRDRDR